MKEERNRVRLLLDVDGVLNAVCANPPLHWPAWKAFRARPTRGGQGFRIMVADGVCTALSNLHASGVEVLWLTTWGQDAADILAPRLGLPTWGIAGPQPPNDDNDVWWKLVVARDPTTRMQPPSSGLTTILRTIRKRAIGWRRCPGSHIFPSPLTGQGGLSSPISTWSEHLLRARWMEQRMPELLILQGLPASGKSTFALNLVRTDPTWKRVNSDSMREMTAGSVYNPQSEVHIWALAAVIARYYLTRGYNVVSDNTNLDTRIDSIWRPLAEDVGATFTIRLFDTPASECIRRDSLRTGRAHVGEDVIRAMLAKAVALGLPIHETSSHETSWPPS